jgi:hypothetical protein
LVQAIALPVRLLVCVAKISVMSVKPLTLDTLST